MADSVAAPALSPSAGASRPAAPASPGAGSPDLQDDGPETPDNQQGSTSSAPTSRGRGSRGGGRGSRGGGRGGRRTPAAEPDVPEPVAGPSSMQALVFVKDTSNQPNNSGNLVISRTITAADPQMLAEQLYVECMNLENVDHRPKPCGLPTRVFGQAATWTSCNADPSEENTRHSHHYFTIYKKSPDTNAASGQRVYAFPPPAGPTTSTPSSPSPNADADADANGTAAPNTSTAVYTRGLDKEPSPLLSQTVLASYNGQTVVVNLHRSGRYFGNAAEHTAFIEFISGGDEQDRSGAAAVPLQVQMTDAARDAWGPNYTTEHVNWSAIGMLLASVPQVTRSLWLAGPPPDRVRELLVPAPTQSDLHLALLRRSMGFSTDLLAKMRAHRAMVAQSFEVVLAGIDRDIQNMSSAAQAFSTMIAPEETDLARTIARGVTDSSDVDHM